MEITDWLHEANQTFYSLEEMVIKIIKQKWWYVIDKANEVEVSC